MTQDELKNLFTEAYKIIQAERKMRLWVFRSQPDKLRAKIGEMDRLLKIVTDFKDEMKAHVEVEYEQPALLDVPRATRVPVITYGKGKEMVKRIELGSPEAKAILERDKRLGVFTPGGLVGHEETTPVVEEKSVAVVSINGQEMGNLDDLVKEPTKEFKEAMRGLVTRAMPEAPVSGQQMREATDRSRRVRENVDLDAAEKPAQGFDYSQIDEGIRDEVRQLATSIRNLGVAFRGTIIQIGKRLIEVKGMLPHGQFGEWLAAEFAMSDRTARNFMNVAREYESKTEILPFLGDTVLYMLAAPSTPEEARVEVEQAAAEGKKITVAFAEQTVQKHRPEPVQYAPVWELEGKVKEWLARDIGEGGTPDPDTILDMLKIQSGERVKDGSWFDLVMQSIPSSLVYRRDDLIQAINNVRDQRRQAKRQAEAKVVYVDHHAIPVDEVEKYEADKRLVEEIWSEDIVRHLVHVSRTDPINSRAYRTSLEKATVVELQRALDAYEAARRLYTWRDDPERRAEITARIKELSEVPAQEPEPVSDEETEAMAEVAREHEAEEAERQAKEEGTELAWSSDPRLLARPDLLAEYKKIFEGKYGKSINAKTALHNRERPETLPGGRSYHDYVMGGLITVPPRDGNFTGPLDHARVEEMLEALERLPLAGNKTKREVIAARLRRIGYSGPIPEPEAPTLSDAPAPTTETEVAPVPTCRVCGCTDDRSCEGGCWWVEDDLCSACASRFGKAPAIHQPDPRLAKAQRLRDWLAQVRDMAQADYGDLTGRHTDLGALERAVEPMIERLDSLIGMIGGGKSDASS